MTRSELENKMAILLGGRAAESIVFDHLSTGASDDLAKVTDIARSMATQYGMIPELGHVSYESSKRTYLGLPAGAQREYSEATAREIDTAVKMVIDRAFLAARGVIAQHRDVLERGATKLLEVETLDETQLAELFSALKVAPLKASAE
jgi:cell division protease FtsH